jgi:hypothetical protein
MPGSIFKAIQTIAARKRAKNPGGKRPADKQNSRPPFIAGRLFATYL